MHFHDGFYPQSLQQSLNELRCSGELCDVVLEVENQELKAHKSVLSAASSYFKYVSAYCVHYSIFFAMTLFVYLQGNV